MNAILSQLLTEMFEMSTPSAEAAAVDRIFVLVVSVCVMVLSYNACFIHSMVSNINRLSVCNSIVQFVRWPRYRYPIKYYLIRISD